MTLEDKTKNTELSEEEKQAYDKLESLKPYFYKGARNMLAGIHDIVDLLLKDPNDKELYDLTIETYENFEKNYPKITNEDVKKIPELKPLYEIQSLRKELKPRVLEFLSNPTPGTGAEIKDKTKKIIALGQEYDASFKNALHKVQEFNPEYKAEVTDKRTGEKYYYK